MAKTIRTGEGRDQRRRCQGCGGVATHGFSMADSVRAQRDQRYRGTIGYRACLECIALWQRFGRAGLVRPLGVAHVG